MYIYIYGTCMQQHLFEHFSVEGHHSFLEDFSITLIDKTDPSNPLQRQNYGRSTLKTMVSWGLNVQGLNAVSEIAFCFILATGFKRIVIRLDLRKRFWYQLLLFLLSSLSLLLPFSLPFCSFCCNYVGVILVIIGVGVIVSAIVLIFVALLLLLHHCFVLFKNY